MREDCEGRGEIDPENVLKFNLATLITPREVYQTVIGQDVCFVRLESTGDSTTTSVRSVITISTLTVREVLLVKPAD